LNFAINFNFLGGYFLWKREMKDRLRETLIKEWIETAITTLTELSLLMRLIWKQTETAITTATGRKLIVRKLINEVNEAATKLLSKYFYSQAGSAL